MVAYRISRLGKLAMELIKNPDLDRLDKFQKLAQAIAIKELMDGALFANAIDMNRAADALEKYDKELFLEWRDK